MKRHLLFFAFLFYSVISLASSYKGIAPADIQLIESKFSSLKSKSPQISQVDKALRMLMELQRYSFIQASVEEESKNPSDPTSKVNGGLKEISGEITFTAWPLKSIKEIVIRGNDAMNRQDILNVLDIQEGQRLTPDQINPALERLASIYEAKGFLNAKIDLSYGTEKSDSVVLEIIIKEGNPCLIDFIQFRTQNSILEKNLTRETRLSIKKVLTEDRLLEIRNRLNKFLSDERYLTSRISEPSIDYNEERTGARLSFTIERPFRYEFFFEGNKVIGTEDLIGAFNLDKMNGSSLSPRIEFESMIRSLYISKAYARIEVTSTEKDFDSAFLKRVYFNIVEHERSKIRKYHVLGKVSREPEYYIDAIKSNGSSLIRNNYYNRQDLETAGQLLVEDLQNQGFLRAQLLNIRPDWNNRGDFVDVSLNIDEGPRTFIQNIEFLNLSAFTKEQILEASALKVNSPLKLEALEESFEKIKNFYRDQGYLEVEIKNENSQLITYNSDNTLAQVRFDIKEGPQILVESIRVEGNSFTNQQVVLNEIDFQTGEILTPKKIQISVFRLQKMGIFSRVDIASLEHDTPESKRTIIVQVAERQPGLFFTGMGVTNQNQFTYRGFIGSAYRNIEGTARAVSARLDLKYSTLPIVDYVENRASISYLEPYLFGRRTRGRFTLERYSEIFQITNSTVKIQENIEGRSYLEHEFSRNSRFVWNLYTFSNSKTFNRRSPHEERTWNIGSIGPFVELDYRNDIVNPKSGHFTRVDLEYADPLLGSSNNKDLTIQFFKSTANFTHYLPISQTKLTWVNSLRTGYLSNVSRKENSGVPAVKSFFLGSQNSIRGFNPGNQEIFPTNAQLGVQNLTDFYVRRDSHFFLVKTELRFPIWGELGGQIFYDGGSVAITNYHFPDTYRDAVGGGIRFMTPVGAVTLEAGFKLDKKVGEDPFAIHFSIGNF